MTRVIAALTANAVRPAPVAASGLSFVTAVYNTGADAAAPPMNASAVRAVARHGYFV
ncbi:hypothetical protein ACIPY0_20160 [Paenarthrobacter nicotinovorans]|uniref:hypothetical protein n=1 Tax=Paenarthrobacter nicotinovorans TaxID=29320 RepID=UPI00380BAD71